MNVRSLPNNADNARNNLVGKIGFWAAVIFAVTYIAFDVAAICSMTGVSPAKYWSSIAFYQRQA